MSVHREKIDLAKLPHHYDGPVTLAVIGGTGLYDLPNLHPVARLTISTPWGFPSGSDSTLMVLLYCTLRKTPIMEKI